MGGINYKRALMSLNINDYVPPLSERMKITSKVFSDEELLMIEIKKDDIQNIANQAFKGIRLDRESKIDQIAKEIIQIAGADKEKIRNVVSVFFKDQKIDEKYEKILNQHLEKAQQEEIIKAQHEEIIKLIAHKLSGHATLDQNKMTKMSLEKIDHLEDLAIDSLLETIKSKLLAVMDGSDDISKKIIQEHLEKLADIRNQIKEIINSSRAKDLVNEIRTLVSEFESPISTQLLHGPEFGPENIKKLDSAFNEINKIATAEIKKFFKNIDSVWESSKGSVQNDLKSDVFIRIDGQGPYNQKFNNIDQFFIVLRERLFGNEPKSNYAELKSLLKYLEFSHQGILGDFYYNIYEKKSQESGVSVFDWLKGQLKNDFVTFKAEEDKDIDINTKEQTIKCLCCFRLVDEDAKEVLSRYNVSITYHLDPNHFGESETEVFPII